MKVGTRPIDQAYAEAIKPIRNRMRTYRYDLLLDALLRYLNAPLTHDRVQDLKGLPWVAERLILWLLSDSPSQYHNKIVDEQSLKGLVDQAWNCTNKLYSKHIQIKSVKLFVRQAFLPQMPYQINLDSHAITFQLYIISRLSETSNLLNFLNQKAGMPIDLYFQMALVFGAQTNTNKPWFDFEFLQ